MATPPDKIAIWILEAIEAESIRQPDKLLRRLDSVVLGEVMAARKLESADIDRGVSFLVGFRAIGSFGKDGGEVTYMLPSGEQYLAAHRASVAAAEKADRERREDVRLKIYPIIIAILSLWIAYLYYTRGK